VWDAIEMNKVAMRREKITGGLVGESGGMGTVAEKLLCGGVIVGKVRRQAIACEYSNPKPARHGRARLK
jgi:hypothetical protein